MGVLTKGKVSINLGFVKLGADFDESDRQCAWELYTELATRVAVTGKSNDRDCQDFSGEVYAESLASLYSFFGEARSIMRQFPVCSDYVKKNKIDNHLGALIHRALRDVIRPFLEKWQADFRFWWEHTSDTELPPTARQNKYPRIVEMISEWSEVRAIMRAIQDNLAETYKLVDVNTPA